ncbi:MAG: hypothetical protein LBN23_00010, partial [Paludibacter sp.]|nr:hypothetical protein [Paludibacter sp.]
MNMKIYRILTIAAVLLLTTHLQAQVTIGGVTEPAKGALLDLNSTSKGGLLLSNVSITDLGKIPVGADIFSGITAGGAADANDETNLKLAGTVVYNTNPDTGIGLYIWDGENWNKIGAGGKLILSADAGEVTDTFVAEGTDIKSYTSSDPSSALPGIFTFVWIAGENYIENLSITDAGAGKFSVKFWANDRASSRQAVLLITSPGGNSASFVFTQLGDETGCNPDTPAPVIKAENDRFNICSAGAVYLYLDGNPTGSYVWTLNDEEVGWGTKYVATKPGRYIVYANKIGCTAPAPGTAQVSVNVTVAPSSVSIVATGNNGFLCDVGGTVQLFASQATGVVWYKDGVRQADKTGSPIDAGLGVWFAVVEDGDCSSTSSNSVIVQIDPNAGASAITPFNFSVNGVSGLTDIELCSGGSLNLAVIAPQAGVTYTWYNNNITIGIGDAINYNMEGITGDFVLRCRATKSAACSVESLKQANINAGTAPAKPSISGSSGATLCNGTATLNANGSAGATSYIWYAGVDGNNLAKIAGQTAQSYEIVATGYYKVQAVNGNCVSEESNVYRIETTSGTANVTITGTQTANIGETKPYTAVSDNPLGATITWTATGDADPTPANGTGAYFGVKFNAVGTASISLTATNACGTSIITNNDYMVTVAPNCIPTTIVSYSPISKSVTKTQT